MLVAPQSADGETVAVFVPHPAGGAVAVRLTRTGDRLRGAITLPPGVPGVCRWRGTETRLENHDEF